jgi:hypothetical protein
MRVTADAETSNTDTQWVGNPSTATAATKQATAAVIANATAGREV